MDATAATASFPWLSVLIFLPLAGAVLLTIVPRNEPGLARGLAFAWSSLIFLVSLGLLWKFDPGAGYQLAENREWLPSLGAGYRIGIDGISLFLVLLTTLLVPICILSSFKAITERVKEFHIAFLVLETGMIGALVSVDLLLFYVFWEVMLIPMYLLIGVWGGPQRIAAAMKFVVYTLVGSLLMLAGIIYLHLQTPGEPSFALIDIMAAAQNLGVTTQLWVFGGFALAFAIKVPFFPVHTWLPDAHTEAPTAGSVILAGVLLKMGTYGFVRFAMPLFPDALRVLTPLLITLSVTGILYGALLAMVQKDVKRLVAYSSISHLGFVMLGLLALTPEAATGGVFQMLSHGISTGGLFLAVGILYERRHTRRIDEFGGLAAEMPAFAAVFLIICLSSLGLPTTNGFVGEFLVLVGAYKSALPAARVGAVVAASGVILAAVYLLWMYLRVMLGPVRNPKNRGLADLSGREWVVLLPILVLIFVMGLCPGYFLDRIEPSVDRFIGHASGAVSVRAAAAPVRADAPARAGARKANEAEPAAKPERRRRRRRADRPPAVPAGADPNKVTGPKPLPAERLRRVVPPNAFLKRLGRKGLNVLKPKGGGD